MNIKIFEKIYLFIIWERQIERDSGKSEFWINKIRNGLFDLDKNKNVKGERTKREIVGSKIFWIK